MDTTWKAAPHTVAKHNILEKYLAAWFPILGSSHRRIVYIDGFAGPGVYEGGEPGSPVRALEVAINHPQRDRFNEIVFWFIENDPGRCDMLEKEIKKRFPAIKNNEGDRIQYEVARGKFTDSVEGTLDQIESNGQNLAPTFAFLDPFGFAQMPMKIVRRILGYPRCEIMATFMEGFIKRFHTEAEGALDELYGAADWRKIPCGNSTDITYVDLYKQKLKDAGAKYVRTFQMSGPNGNLIYHLVYATTHIKGIKAAKTAMWAVSRTGEYEFSDRTDPRQQVVVDYKDDGVWMPRAASLVLERFRGKKNVAVEDVEEYVLADTPYLFKKGILKGLEKRKPPAITVGNRKRSMTYPPGSKISFEG